MKAGKIRTLAGCLAAVLVMNMMAMMPAMAEEEILAGAEVQTAEAIELMAEPEVEEPKTEEPKAEEPKVEEPKPEQPKAEEPKTEEPKAEEPKVEEPKAEEPKTEEPKTEEPVVEEPKSEEPKVEEPKTEEPVTEELVVEEPAVEEPATEEPVTEEPTTEEPVTEEPVVEEPAAEEPVTEEPVVEEPIVEEPATEEPVTEEPAVEEPATEEPVTEEPVVEEPAIKEPVTEEPVVEEPAAEPEEEEAEPETDAAEPNEEAAAEPEEEETNPETDTAELDEEAAGEPEEEETNPETDTAEPDEEIVEEPETDETEVDAEPAYAAASRNIDEYVQAIIEKYHTRVDSRQEKTEQLTKTKEVRTTYITFENGITVVVIRRYINGVLFDEQILDNGKAEAIDTGIRENEEYMEKVREREEKERAEREEREAKERAEREEQEAIDRQLDEFRNQIASCDGRELMELYIKLVQDHEQRIETEASAGSDEEEEEQIRRNRLHEKAYQRTLDLLKESVTATFKLIPGGSFFAGTAGKIVSDLLGIDDDEKTDLKKVIEKGNNELKKDLLIGFTDTKDSIDNYGTLKSYGATLDAFTEFANLRADGIKDYKTKARYTELEKQVWIANLIGSSDEWITGANNGNIMMSMYSAAEVFRGEKNMDSRDIYNVIYDMNKQNSLFTGEAMVKSQDKIEAALGGFLRNCQVVTEILKAHEAISNLTQEEIDSLEPQTRAIYDRIHTDSETVMKQAAKIMGIFLGDKEAVVPKNRTGIFEKAEEFYQHDKTIYIDHGHNQVNLAGDFKQTSGREYFRENGNVDLNGVDASATASGLTKEDLEKIANQAKASRMTIRQYLEACGFTVNGYFLVVGSKSDLVYHWDGLDMIGVQYQGLSVYDVDQLNPQVQTIDLAKVKYHKTWATLKDCDDHLNNIGLYNLDYKTLTFQTK